MQDEKLVGRCGLYCGACTIYRANRDDGEYLTRVANYFKCPPEKVACEGCQALTPNSWGYECKIVQCLRSKGFDFCFQCGQYDARACEKFEDLAKRYLESNVDVRANLERMKAGKTEDWLKESRDRFKCPNCRKPLPESSKKCYHCKQEFAMI